MASKVVVQRAEFPRARIDEIFRKNSPEFRVSEDAKDALMSVLQILGVEISRQAVAYAISEKRKSVSEKDIKRAIAELWD